MTSPLPEGVKGPSEIQPTKPIQGNEGLQKPVNQPFSSYMQGNNAVAPGTSQISPMDLFQQGKTNVGDVSKNSVAGKIGSTSNALGQLQDQLQTKNLQANSFDSKMVRNKLTGANELIKSAARKVGVPDGSEVPKKRNPIERFLALISDGQDRLNQAQKNLSELGKDGKELSFKELMQIQIELSRAQRAVELSSGLLSKALSSMQMLLNVQI